MCCDLLQVESTQGTPLANTADVSLQVKTDSADEATITALQLTNLLHNGTAMSVSISPFFFEFLLSSCLNFCTHRTYNTQTRPNGMVLRNFCVEQTRQLRCTRLIAELQFH